MKVFELNTNRQIIGRAGERGGIKLTVNIRRWLEAWPDGLGALMCQRPDGKLFPVAVTVSGEIMSAELPEECLQMPGVYSYTPTWTENETVRVGRKCECVLMAAYEPPRPHRHGPDKPHWATEVLTSAEGIKRDAETIIANISTAAANAETAKASAEAARDAAMAAKTDAEAARDTAVAAAVHSPKIEDGTWHVWDQQSNDYVDTDVEAQGPKGEKGDPGENPAGAVLYDATQTITDAEKAQARTNIGAADTDDVSELKSAINAYIDSSDYLDGFPNTPVYNATYTSGKIADWGTATKRIINTTTLSYPMDVIYTANLGYEFYAYTFAEPHTFTGNGSVTNTGSSGAWVKEYHANAFSNVLLIVRKTNTTNIYVTDWPNAISAIAYPTDLTIVTEKLNNLLVDNTEYYVKGKSIDVSRQYYTVKNLSFYPTEETGKTMQGVAVYGGVVVQMFSNGSAELFDMSTGNKIITLNMNAGHGGSASFSDTFYDVNDEFPLLYVASFEEPKTYVYRITRLDYTLVKTYYTPIEIAGYRQESCYDRFSGTLWVIGYVADSKTAGEGWVVTNWDLINTTDNGDGTYTPTLITTFQLPFIPYVQSISVFNNQLFVVTGIDLHANPEELTRIWVIDKYGHAVISVMDMFPETILNAEPEGIDFIGTGHKYDMFLATRATKAYYIISIDH